MYGMMTGCFVERVREKCGEKAATLADKELSDLPEEIEEACRAVGEIDTDIIEGIHLLDNDKRK